MTFTAEELKDSQIELIVTLDKKDLFYYVSEAEKKLIRETKIKGFRPGKASKEAVRQKIGEQTIREEALNLAVQSSLAKIIAEEKLDLLKQSNFEIKENSPEKLIYKVLLNIFPNVKLGEYKGLTVKRNIVAVDETEVSNTLQEIISSRTVLKEVKRPARIGDKVEIDFWVKDGETPIEGGKSENHPVVLGENKFIPGFEAQIIGLKTGEKKNFSLKVPADYFQRSIAGKDLDFQVVLKRVEERTVPKLDDNLAKSLGNFDSLAELKANIKEGLMLEKEAKEKERIRLAILKEISNKSKIEAPAMLIEKHLDSMILGLDNELHEKGMELGLYLAHIKKSQDDLRREWHAKAEEQVKMSLIVRAIGKEEHLKVGEDEINSEFETVLQQYMARGGLDGGLSGPEMLQKIDPEQMKNKIKDMLFNEKVFQFLEKQTKFS